MKKRMLAFAAALLMLLTFTVSAFAYTALPLKFVIDPVEPETTAAVPTRAAKFADFLSALQNLWHQYGLVIIIVLVILCVIIAITISEKEQEKKRQAELDKQPKKNHEK